MNPWEISTIIVLLAGFLFFNYSFWSGQWSKSENESQGLLEWCFNEDGNKCCQSVSDREIITQGKRLINLIKYDDIVHNLY